MATLYYRPYSSEPVRERAMPPHDAIENILPEYKYIFTDAKARQPEKPTEKSTDNPPSEADAPWEQLDIRGTDVERTTLGLLDYQQQELDRYRAAVKTMGQDIVSLRQDVQERDAANTNLKLQLEKYEDATRLMLDSGEMDGLSQPELIARYVAIKQKLNKQTIDLRQYKDRVTELQNTLIKRNDAVKQHATLSEAHRLQQAELQRLGAKREVARRLADTCRSQEAIIQKMEALLSKTSKNTGPDQKEANEMLRLENGRLRNELEQIKESQRVTHDLEETQHQDRVQLTQRLETQNSRIRSLEAKIADNARAWASERSDLHLRLREAEYGLSQANKHPENTYRTYPKIQPHPSPLPKDPPRKYSKAPLGALPHKSRGHNHPAYRDSFL